MDTLVYVAVRSFFAVIAGLPSSWAHYLCRAIAGVIYRVDGKHRRIGLMNLRIAFPEQEEDWHRKILRESFLQMGDHAVAIAGMTHWTKEELRRRVEYEPGFGVESYETARAEGKGVLFLTAHIGAWELLPAAHAAHTRPLNFLVRPLDNRQLDRWLTGLRERFGNGTIDKSHSLRKVIRLLRNREDVGFLLDQNVQEKEGVYAPLFGVPASTSPALAALALRTRAPVVPGFIVPARKRGQYLIRFYPPLHLQPTGDFEKDVYEGTARFNRYIEEVIQQYPACWLWGHRRFSAQPDGRDIYSE